VDHLWESCACESSLLLVLSSAIFSAASVCLLSSFCLKAFGFGFFGGCAAPAFVGGYLLWTDFVAPRFAITNCED
jgi:hypothetical protein